MTKILIVDDEESILAPLNEMLSGEGYRIRAFDDPLKALELLRTQEFDLAIFDIKMPQMNGYELLSAARAIRPGLPVIFLSSKQEEQDQIIGFTLGADDFVGKPFSKHLLLFRIKSVLKRHTPDIAITLKPIEVSELVIDRERHLVKWRDEEVSLTVTECMLLISLAERPGMVKKRNQLMDAAYEGSVHVSDRTIDSHIRNIRKKFSEVDSAVDLIGTVQGLGYKLKV
ncbi:response regulator transcription factor [Paracoccaceae bacterium]|nr:response regulator transcription factor [Paracoccaceae bacterium]